MGTEAKKDHQSRLPSSKSLSSINLKGMNSPNHLQRCSLCILSEAFPNIRFDEEGRCQYCVAHSKKEPAKTFRESLWEQLEEIVRTTKNKHTGSYDCIVAFSGGKDSCYTLKLMVEEFGLKCLAILIDNGFVAPRAQVNARKVTEALGVDYSVFVPAPAFVRNMFAVSATGDGVHPPSAMKRASAMCNSCISLINAHMLQQAAAHGVPMIAGGYISGQVPEGAVALTLDLRHHHRTRQPMIDNYVHHFGNDAMRYFNTPTKESKEDDGASRILIVNPMLAVHLSDDEIIEAIRPMGWERPKGTGKNSSNCQLNDLGIAVHHKRHGFHPYAFEVSEQIRAGLMTREEALTKVEDVPQFEKLKDRVQKLGLDTATIK